MKASVGNEAYSKKEAFPDQPSWYVLTYFCQLFSGWKGSTDSTLLVSEGHQDH